MTDLAEIEEQLGAPPGSHGLRMTPKNVELIQRWMIAQGFDEARILGAREDTLHRAYTKPSYLRQMRSRADYFPGARKEPSGGRPMWDIKPKPPQEPPRPPATPDLASQIAAALQPVLAAQPPAGITEYRVIEIIHEHVPAIVRQVVSEMFAEFSAAQKED